MRENMWKKGLVIVITVLFFGASGIPSFGVENVSNTDLMLTNDTSEKLLFKQSETSCSTNWDNLEKRQLLNSAA